MTHQQTRSIIVRASVPTVFGAWTRFEEFPRVSPRVVSVEPAGEGRSHWVIKGPFGTRLEWDALLTRFERNKRIAWSSTPESPVRTSGQVTFTELGPDETQVTVVLQYATNDRAADPSDPMLGDAGAQLEEDLRRFKAHVEGRPAPVASAGASHAGGGG
jgi:uncharacterized membrane protein